MKHKIYIHPWKVLEKRLESGDVVRVSEFLESISSTEKARTLSRIDKQSRQKLFSMITFKQVADILDDLPDEQAAEFIGDIEPQKAAEIIEFLPKHKRVDILGDLANSGTTAEDILDTMPLDEKEETQKLLDYPEDTAGGLMDLEYLVYQDNMTAAEVIENLQKYSERYSDYNVQYAYIVSNDQKLVGVLQLRDLLLSKGNRVVKDIMHKDPLSIKVNASLNEIVRVFEDCNYLGIPVVDATGRLEGIVRRYEAMEAVGERETDTYLKASGIVGGEEFRSMPLFERSKRRLSWLSINIVLNILAASVIAFYQDTLSAVIALAVFLPIISDMSGCSGNQAVAVSIRELTMGITKPTDLMNTLWKECSVGLINGLVLGILLGLVAFLWKGNAYLGIVAGGALAINTVVAVCLGGIIPLVLHKFKKDPALASGPILTTVTDMCGFFFALGFATMMLPYLT